MLKYREVIRLYAKILLIAVLVVAELESFKQLIDLTSYSVLHHPPFPLKMSETKVIDFNKKRQMVMTTISNFQNAKSKDNRKTEIVEFEQGLKDYKKALDAWLELESKCSDICGFCTRRS